MNSTHEYWTGIVPFDGYEVSTYGAVRSLDRRVKLPGKKDRFTHGKAMKLSLDRYGYLRVQLCRNGRHYNNMVHRLVAVAFLAAPNDPMQVAINHISGNKTDNRVSNLEWVTNQENTKHAIEVLGKHQRGTANGNSLLKEVDVHTIRNLKGFATARTIAVRFGVSMPTIHGIWEGKSWKHLVSCP